MMLRPRFAFRIKVSSLPWRTFDHIFGELCVRDIGGRSLPGLPYNYMLFEKKPDHGCAWRIKGNWVGIPGKAVTVCGVSRESDYLPMVFSCRGSFGSRWIPVSRR